MNKPLLEVDIACHAGSFALEAAFALERGTLALLGPSGAGKSLTLKTIAGIAKPDRGRITLNGNALFDGASGIDVPTQFRCLGYVPQQYALFPHLTVAANLAYGLADVSRGERDQRVAEMLHLLGMEDQRGLRPRQLSGGQRQRVAVGRALIVRPDLLLLDEPFAALDPELREDIGDATLKLARATNTPVLLVTHDRAEALRLGDHIAVLMSGRVRQVGTPAEVFGSPVDEEVAQFVGAETIVPGRVRAVEGGVGVVDISGHIIEGGGEPVAIGDEVLVCLRPEDVVLGPVNEGGAPTSARNHLPATVTRIVQSGPFLRVEVDAGFPLVALITKQSRENLEIEVGAPVTATFKAAAVHLIRKRLA